MDAIIIEIHLLKQNGPLGKILVFESSHVPLNGSILPMPNMEFHLMKKKNPSIVADGEVLFLSKTKSEYCFSLKII